jgi:hypothetical protein
VGGARAAHVHTSAQLAPAEDATHSTAHLLAIRVAVALHVELRSRVRERPVRLRVVVELLLGTWGQLRGGRSKETSGSEHGVHPPTHPCPPLSLCLSLFLSPHPSTHSRLPLSLTHQARGSCPGGTSETAAGTPSLSDRQSRLCVCACVRVCVCVCAGHLSGRLGVRALACVRARSCVQGARHSPASSPRIFSGL